MTASRPVQVRSSLRDLRALFRERITARDIASPLVSFDDTHDARRVRDFMVDHGFDVVGVRTGGRVAGWCHQDDITPRTRRLPIRGLLPEIVVDLHDPMEDVVRRMQPQGVLFVEALGTVQAIVTNADLHKAPVRLWLFGLIGLAEMQMARLIREHLADGAWESFLSSERLGKARRLFRERERRNQAISLDDCLQWADRVAIISKSPSLAAIRGDSSRNAFRSVAKRAEDVRNSLAHGGELSPDQWDRMPELVGWLERVVEVCEAFRAEDREG